MIDIISVRKIGRVTFERNDLARGVHNGRVCCDGSTNHVGGVSEVDDDDQVLLASSLSHTDESV